MGVFSEMTIYIALYIYIIAVYHIARHLKVKTSSHNYNIVYEEQKIKREKIFVVAAFVAIIFVVGLRSPEMGIDLNSYLPSFDHLISYSWRQILSMRSYLNYEKGYIIFNKLIGILSSEHQVFIFICAAASIIPIGYVVFKHSEDKLLSTIIFLGIPTFLIVFSALRQAIAVGITTASFIFIEKKKVIPFIFLVLLASAFHSSALVFLIAYPLYQIKISNKTALVSIGLLPLIWLIKYPLFAVLSKLFTNNAVPDNNGAVTLFIVFSLIYVFCVLCGNRDNAQTNGLTNLFFVACAVQAMGGMYSTVIRVGYYFIIYLILLLPAVLFDIKKRMNGRQYIVIRILIYICFIIYGLYTIRNGGWAETYPYSFFWRR